MDSNCCIGRVLGGKARKLYKSCMLHPWASLNWTVFDTRKLFQNTC